MSSEAPSGDAFTTLDWMGVVVAGTEALALTLLPIAGRTFGRMYRDFGGDIPAITRWIIAGQIPVGLAVLTVIGLTIGVQKSLPLGQRRAWVVGSFALGGVGFGGCLVGLYLPIFALSNALAR